jgi:hypothetical protein
MVLDGVSNDNEIAWNLNQHQSISRRTYIIFFIFFNIYLKIYCQDCQNNPLSSDPHPFLNILDQLYRKIV